MELVDRVALIVRPKRRFLEWANTLDGPHLTLDKLPSLETLVLLVPLEPLDLQRIIDEYAEEIFEQMLEGWHTDEAMWPSNRTPHVFRDWFDARLIDEVWDADPDESWDGLESGLDCGWCGAPRDPDAPVQTVNVKVHDRTLLHGLAPGQVPIPLGDRVVTGVIPAPGSEAADEADLVFGFCGDKYERAFRKRWEQERGRLLS